MDPLIAQYEAWAYPRPIQDLEAYVASGGRDLSDPSRLRPKLWPRGEAPETLNILVAGCGSNQAAIIAQANPTARVVGIDPSGAAIGHHQHLKAAHQIQNLTLHTQTIEEVGERADKFDLIISTGVIHHLASPQAGLCALREVLAPHGVISAMLYGKTRRAGVSMVQEALTELGAERNPGGVRFARDVVQRLPTWHPALAYLSVAPDLDYDAGFVDTFLNAREQTYTVPEIMDLTAGAGLAFQAWLDGLHYSPAAVFPADSEIHDRIHELPAVQQWHITDLLGQMTAAHRFLLCHPERDSIAPLELGADTILHRNPDLSAVENGDSGLLSREWHRFSLTGPAWDIFRNIDGKAPWGELTAGISDTAQREFAWDIFNQLAEWDHVFFSHREAIPTTNPQKGA